VQAWLDADMGGAAGARVLVKGCGKVGSTVARLLVAAGTVVLTLDTVPSRADIPGTTNVSSQDWWTIPCDVFAPCSTSRFITQDIAERIPCRAVVGSSNAPFASPQALAVLEARGLTFVPEAISSAGAVLADSIKCFDAEAYRWVASTLWDSLQRRC
jgi:leucine dehydrogenase